MSDDVTRVLEVKDYDNEEITAMAFIMEALAMVPQEAHRRVLDYIVDKYVTHAEAEGGEQ